MAVQNPVRAREQRAIGALEDVAAVEQLADDLYEVTTVSDVYRVDLREPVCECPDYEYNDPPRGECKHVQAARIEAGETPVPTPESPALCPDCVDEMPCFEHFDGGSGDA
mgnify:CR=1 FL=1